MQPSQLFNDKYLVIRKICQAHLGVVYYGIRREGDRGEVVIKMLTRSRMIPYQELMIRHEAWILNQVNHRHVIKLYDFIVDSSYFYLIFEYASRGDLFEYIENCKNRKGKLSKGFIKESMMKRICYEVSSALDYCYNHHNVIHRDIKLENIFISKDGSFKVGDFGFATFASERSNRLCGTREYMSPELLLGNIVSCKTDIWSLGILMYECICGEPPFQSHDHEQLKNKILSGKIDISRLKKNGASDDLINLLLKMLDLKLDRRVNYQEILNHPWLKSVSHHPKDSSPSLHRRRNSI